MARGEKQCVGSGYSGNTSPGAAAIIMALKSNQSTLNQLTNKHGQSMYYLTNIPVCRVSVQLKIRDDVKLWLEQNSGTRAVDELVADVLTTF